MTTLQNYLIDRKVLLFEMEFLLKQPKPHHPLTLQKVRTLFEQYKQLRQTVITEYGEPLWYAIIRNEMSTNQFPFSLRN